MQLLQYFGVFISAVVFEFAYIAWVNAATRGGAWTCAGWAVAVAGLSLAGVGGALVLPGGWAPYLAGVGIGSFAAVKFRTVR